MIEEGRLVFRIPITELDYSVYKDPLSENVTIQQQQWKSSTFLSIFSFVAQWKINQLSFNIRANPITIINKIHFPFLKELYIRENQISSLEGMSKLSMPSLTMLSLSNNHLRTVRDMRKFSAQNLKKLYLYGNKIMDFETTAEQSLKELNILFIEWLLFTTQKNNVQCFDIRWICKFESSQLADIRLQSNGRIKEKEVRKQLKKKFQTLKE